MESLHQNFQGNSSYYWCLINPVLSTKGMYLSIENCSCNFNKEIKLKYSGLIFYFLNLLLTI